MEWQCLPFCIFQLQLYEAGNPEISNEILNDEAEKEAEKARLLKLIESGRTTRAQTAKAKKDKKTIHSEFKDLSLQSLHSALKVQTPAAEKENVRMISFCFNKYSNANS